MTLISPKFLTKRQQEILACIALGKTTKQTAGELKISDKTVEYHRMKLMIRLGLFSVPELVHYSLAVGLIENLFKAQLVTVPQAIEIAAVEAAVAPTVHYQEPTPEEKALLEKQRRAELVKKKVERLRIASTNLTAGIIGKWRTARRPANVNDKYGDTFAIHASS